MLDIVRIGNLSSNNAGPILIWDFLLPVVAISLYILARAARERTATSPALHWSARWRLDAGRTPG